MSERTRNAQLLKDVLSEDRVGAFQEALLGQTLKLARRRRGFRRARRITMVVMLVSAGLWVMWRQPPGRLREASARHPYALVITRPLPQSSFVETTPLSADRIVISAPNVVQLTTAAAQPVLNEINDADLLALAAPRAAVLIRLGPHSAELVFAPPDSQANP